MWSAFAAICQQHSFQKRANYSIKTYLEDMLHLYIEPERVIEATVRTFESVPEPNWYNLISDKEVEPCIYTTQQPGSVVQRYRQQFRLQAPYWKTLNRHSSWHWARHITSRIGDHQTCTLKNTLTHHCQPEFVPLAGGGC